MDIVMDMPEAQPRYNPAFMIESGLVGHLLTLLKRVETECDDAQSQRQVMEPFYAFIKV